MSTRTYIKNEHGHYICPFCGDIKKNQSTMFYHMNKHEGRLPYECNTCKKAFVQKQELQLHVLKWHPEPAAVRAKIIYCPFDGCTFKDVRKGNVRTHCMRKHVSEYIEGILEREADGTWNCSMCAHCSPSAAGFYYHLYACLQNMAIIPPESAAGQALAELKDEVDN